MARSACLGFSGAGPVYPIWHFNRFLLTSVVEATFRAAELAVFLASAASDGITGKIISALWDNWQTWPRHVDELRRGDLYTLRRVTGRDRGASWGDK